jgi:hypothetical protein
LRSFAWGSESEKPRSEVGKVEACKFL